MTTTPDPRLLSEERLAEIAGRAKKASKGPWIYQADANSYGAYFSVKIPSLKWRQHFLHTNCKSADEADRYRDNFKFIAHARTDIPALLLHIQAQAEALSAVEEECHTLKQMFTESQRELTAAERALAEERRLGDQELKSYKEWAEKRIETLEGSNSALNKVIDGLLNSLAEAKGAVHAWQEGNRISFSVWLEQKGAEAQHDRWCNYNLGHGDPGCYCNCKEGAEAQS